MSSRIRKIFFDAGDTLIRIRLSLDQLYAGIINENKGIGIEADDVKQAMKEQLNKNGKISGGYFRYSDGWFDLYIKGMLKSLDCPEPWDGIRDGLFQLFDDPSTFEVFPDVKPCLNLLRERGFKMAVVSNWGYRLPRLLDRIGLGRHFETIIASADVEAEKPDPRIFRIAIERTGALPSETVHVGDNPEADISGAQAAGIHGILIDRSGSDTEMNGRITSLGELIGAIESVKSP